MIELRSASTLRSKATAEDGSLRDWNVGMADSAIVARLQRLEWNTGIMGFGELMEWFIGKNWL